MSSDVIVTVCAPEQVQLARALLQREAANSQGAPFSFDALSASVRAEDILIAAEHGHLLGAILHQMGSGRLGWLWAPALTAEAKSARHADTGIRLVRAAVHSLTTSGARLVQTMLAPGDWGAELLRTCGFRLVTEIVQMSRGIDDECSGLAIGADLVFVPFRTDLEGHFFEVVEQTYKNSLDCPELEGLRPVQEVLEGYRAAGDFREEHWSLARRENEFVGCVFVAYFPEPNGTVLQYLGVIPSHRRRGIGHGLMVHALQVANDAGAERMSLAVDQCNVHALRLYSRMGFVETDRRAVYIISVSEQMASSMR